ncbi:hypothetical protein [Sagittula sp. SSi028]|uniref:hypothetical protein n=1 Tax=Sagittula sp. SSi028 TaxID=3400636 RepID=UPI003AF614A3
MPLQIAKSSGSAMGARAKIAKAHIEGETIEVSVKTLDDLIDADRPISLLQLDIKAARHPRWKARVTSLPRTHR